MSGNGISQTAIKLKWNDNSANENGFKVYRSATSTGTYALVGTTAANAKEFTDNELQANSLYFYKVNAFNADGNSVDAGPLSVSTINFSVYINFSAPGEPAPSPWNNTDNEPYVGNTYPNLKNQLGNNTGIRMSVIENDMGTSFAAFGYKGSVTGNNSGVYPDVVMKSYWWIEQIEVASLKFDNLDLGMEYDFVFFGSRGSYQPGYRFYHKRNLSNVRCILQYHKGPLP